MEKLVSQLYVLQELHFQAHVAVVKPQFMHAHQDHIGTDIDAFI